MKNIRPVLERENILICTSPTNLPFLNRDIGRSCQRQSPEDDPEVSRKPALGGICQGEGSICLQVECTPTLWVNYTVGFTFVKVFSHHDMSS
ncbi:MAG: hypothetical protein HYW14_01280 [Planctomycetes bacterium]|nr:hypothetical protein [Planctomycetota bacterium]